MNTYEDAETAEACELREAYNKKHGITPKSIEKAVHDIAEEEKKLELRRPKRDPQKIPKDELKRLIETLENKMDMAAQNYEFEKAADLRDEIDLLKKQL